MLATLFFQLVIFSFIALNILVLSKLFPIEQSPKRKATRKI